MCVWESVSMLIMMYTAPSIRPVAKLVLDINFRIKLLTEILHVMKHHLYVTWHVCVFRMIDHFHLFNLVHDQHCDSCPVLWEGWYLYLSPECLQVLTDFTDRRSCLERDRESNIKALNTIPQQQAAVYIYMCVCRHTLLMKVIVHKKKIQKVYAFPMFTCLPGSLNSFIQAFPSCLTKEQLCLRHGVFLPDSIE